MCVLLLTKSLVLQLFSYFLLFILCFAQLVKSADSVYDRNPHLLQVLKNDVKIEQQNIDNFQKEISSNGIRRFNVLEEVIKLLPTSKNYYNTVEEDNLTEKRRYIPKQNVQSKDLWQDGSKFKKETDIIEKLYSKAKNKNINNRKVRRRFSFPYVKVIINGRSIIKDLFHSLSVTYEPNMDVFRALMMAALKFHRNNESIINPFNVELTWRDDIGCDVISAAAGISNTYAKKWKIRVLRRRGKKVYSGECIPSDRLTMRPGTRLVLKYTRS